MKLLMTLIYTCIFLIPLSSCATDYTGKGKGNPTQPLKVDEAFYSIDRKGIPVAIDAKGNKIELEEVGFPITEVKEILNIQHLTIIEIKGSHYELICSRVCRIRYLPHP